MILPFFAQEFLKGNEISLDIISSCVYNITMFLQLFKDYPIILGVLSGVAFFLIVALLGCVFVKWHVRNKADIFFRVLFFLLTIAFLIPVLMYVFSKTDALGIQVAINGGGIDFLISSKVVFFLPIGADILSVILTDTGFWFICFNGLGSILCFILSCVKGRTSKAIAFKKAKKDIKKKVEATEKAKMEAPKPQMPYGEFMAFNNGGANDAEKEDNGEFVHTAFAEDGFSSGNAINTEDFSVDIEEPIVEDGGFFNAEDEGFNDPLSKVVKEDTIAYSVGFENVAYSEGNFDLFDGEDITKDLPDAFSELEMEEVHNSRKIFDSLVKLVESEPEVIPPLEDDLKLETDFSDEPIISESNLDLEDETIELSEDEAKEELINEKFSSTESAEINEDSETEEVIKEEPFEEETFEDAVEEKVELKEEVILKEEEKKEPIVITPFVSENTDGEETKIYPEIKIRTVKINRPRQMEADIVKEEENPFKGAKSKKEIEVAPDAINKKEPVSVKKGGAQKKKSAIGAKSKAEKEVEAEQVVLPLTRKHIILNRTNVVNVFSEYLKEKQLQEKDELENNISTIIIK